MASPVHDNTALGFTSGSPRNGEPLLEQLVRYFVASKRSLASTHHVWHANEMVAQAKGFIEDIATINAKNTFLRQCIKTQMHTLKAIRLSLEDIGQEMHMDFKAKLLQMVLQDLDAADVRVKQTVQRLQKTQVETSIRPQLQDQTFLYDFVDEHGVDGLMNAFRQCIDDTSQAQGVFADSNAAFDNELKVIEDLLRSSNLSESGQNLTITASTFRSLESHAADMAQELESLISHYDLCMTALKHTDGGGEAAQKAKVELPAGISVESFHQGTVAAPIAADERAEMMSILEKDAAEVDGAVQEIRDRSTDMETGLEHITSIVESLRNEHESLGQSMKLLVLIGGNLSRYIQASADLQECWEEQKRLVEEKLEELEGLREFYDGFLHAYDGLIAEVSRRNLVKGKMEKVIRDAMLKLEKLYNDDLDERQAFRQDQGDYLPSDIWPGLADLPARYEFRLAVEPVTRPLEASETVNEEEPARKEAIS